MSAYMVINSPVLARLHRERKEREARIASKAVVQETREAPAFGPDACAHVRAWNSYIAAMRLSGIEGAEARALDANWTFVSNTRRIIEVVAKHYGVTVGDILCQRRDERITRPRHVAMFLARDLTLRSYPELGRSFGGRDHTTVRKAVITMDHRAAEDAELRDEIEGIRARLLEEIHANASGA